MGIDLVRIGAYVWKFVKLFLITSYSFFRKDPYVGVILISLLLLYMFLPLFFIILVVCSPLIVLVAVTVRVYLKYKRAKLQKANEVEKKKRSEVRASRSSISFKDDGVIRLRNNGTTINRQMSRRTNFADKNRLNLEKKDDMVALTANTMELLGLTSQNEGKSKVLLDVNKSGSVDREEGCVAEKVIVSGSWSRPEDDDAGEEEKQDNQKSLMDLGVSEMERNKRLETLISKRREKKEGGKGLIDTDRDSDITSEIGIEPVVVSRATPSDTPHSADKPGSAPPILLPSRNPFDLPYDPFEEKPNLMGDNFHEEFTAAHPKDLVFSRHESFLLGTSSSLQPSRRQPKKGGHDLFGGKTLDKKNPELMHKDGPENLRSMDDRDDETNSEYTDDISEKQSAHEGTSDMQETVEERDQLNSINGTLQADKEPNDRLLQSSAEASSSMLRTVNENLMSEIMNEEKDTSFKRGEVVSQISTLEDPVPELPATVDESESRFTGDNEVESSLGSDAIETLKSESEESAEESAVVDSQVELHASAVEEEHVPEPPATTEEYNSRSSKDLEGENKHGSEDIDKGQY